jgi:tape measure domain-containing protein
VAERVGGIYYDVTLDTAQMIRGQRAIDAGVAQAARSFNVITAAVKVYAATLAVVKAINMSEDFRLLKARVDIAAGSVEKGTDAWRELQSISKTTQTALEANALVFNRLNQSVLQLGGTQRDTLNLTDLLGKAIKVSGASATEGKSAMIQFAQALGSGKLAGDELRSLMENAPYLMQRLAEGLGVPIGQLKALGEQGKLTSDVVVNALNKAAASIERDFAKVPQTFAGAMTVMEDAAARAAESLDTVTGSSAVATGVIKGLTEVVESLALQFQATATESDKLGRNQVVKTWADKTTLALSYLADGADLVWQTLSVVGRNVAFVLQGIGTEIGGIGAQIAAVMRGDFAQAKAIGKEMEVDAARRRKELDAKDKETLRDRLLAGQKIRQQMEALALTPEARREVADRKPPGGKLKSQVDQEEARKLQARRLAAQAYYEGLVADQKTAMDKIDAEERKALTENERRMAADKANHDIYAKAKVAITEKYARERALLEEQNNQQIAEFRIATTIDEIERVQAIRDEEIRRAQAQQRLGVITAEQAEREKAAAIFRASQAFAELADRNARARAEAEIAITKSQERAIVLIREEAVRQAEDAYRRGRMTFEEAEAAKVVAVQRAIEQQKALEASRAQTRIGTLQIQASTGGNDAQEALIRAQAEEQMRQVEEARLRDLEASQLYADQKVAIEADMHRRIAEMRAANNMAALSATSDAFGAMVDVLRKSGEKQSGIFKVMFAAQKAFAIASSIVAIQTGIAKAASGAPWPANLAAMASVVAATASIVSTIQGTNYGGGRRYGGPVAAGSMYRVNEAGRPEMFTAANGAQYMLPTKSGKVSPAGGGGGLKVIVNNNTGVEADARASQGPDGSVIVDLERRMVNAVAADTRGGGVTARATAARMGTNSGATLNRRRV